MAEQALLQDEQDNLQQDPGQQQDQQTAAPVEPADADEVALAAAEAELAAEEEAAKAAGGTPAAVVEAQPGAEPAPAAAGPAAPAAPVMVPIERLNQEAAKRRQAEDEALLERGRREALELVHKAGGTPAGTQPVVEQPKSPAEQIKDLRAKQVADAEAYEAGDISAVEWTKRNAQTEDTIAEIRSSAVAQVAIDRATAPQTSEWLAAETAKIEQDFPVLAHVDQEELAPLAEIAKREMRKEGKPFDGRSRESILELRQRTAELADHNFGHRLPAGGSPAKPATSATPATPGPTSPAPTAAQRAAKAGLAERMPPDITKAGSAASATGLTASRIEKMDARELDGLTDAELAALEQGLF